MKKKNLNYRQNKSYGNGAGNNVHSKPVLAGTTNGRGNSEVLAGNTIYRNGSGMVGGSRKLPRTTAQFKGVTTVLDDQPTTPSVRPVLPAANPLWAQATTAQPTPKTFTLKPGLALVGLALGAFILRISLSGLQSAYMDESSFVLTGRYLLERHEVYAGALNWTYGSYLWSLVAGSLAMVGGLEMVRGFTALCGALMVLSTVIMAARLLPRKPNGERRWLAAGIAGFLMAVLPTGIGLGHFGTYDSLAGAAFMGGAALLVPARFPLGAFDRTRRFELAGAAGLLFVAFLAKYLDAVYFPFICLALLIIGWRNRTHKQVIGWFIAPLSLACLIYFAIFQNEMVTLLAFSTTYSDLESPQPLREYVLERPELWVLLGVALVGLWRVRKGKLGLLAGVTLGGFLILAAFQAAARPDYDFWKHSIYVIFFLSPLAGLALEPLANFLNTLFSRFRNRIRNKTKPRLWPALAGLGVAVAGVLLLFFSLQEAQKLVSFYPNLNPSLAAIQDNTSQAQNILTNDGALRFYLYPRILTDQVTDPFYFNYNSVEGLPAYKAAVSDRYFDTIIFDEGSGPQGQQLPQQLGDLLTTYYQPVYTNDTGNNGELTIYKPRTGEIIIPETDGVKVYRFEGSNQGWGGQPENEDLQPGKQATVSSAQLYQGHPTLKFESTPQVTFLGVKQKVKAGQIKTWVYIEPQGADETVVSVGMVGFDTNWQWHDDGFKQTVVPGKWTELTWNLDTPIELNEIGLKFANQPVTAYIGEVTVSPDHP